MKKKALLTIIIALLLVAVFAFSGCGMIGQKIAAEDFDKVFEDSAKAMADGSWTMKFTIKMENTTEKEKVTMTIKAVVEDGKKAHFTGTVKGDGVTKEEEKMETYMEVKDGKFYEIYKDDSGKWVGKQTNDNFFDQLYIDPIETADSLSFDALEYKMGKYYVKDDILGALGLGDDMEYYLVFKSGKLSTLSMKGDMSTFGIKIKTDIKVKITYNGKVTIPSYTVI